MYKSVLIYTTPTCPDCNALKRWLRTEGIVFDERDLTDPAVAEEAKSRTGVRVAPITFAGEQFFCGTFPTQKPMIAAVLGLPLPTKGASA